MRILFFFSLFLLSVSVSGQHYVSDNFIDSLHTVEKGHIGKSFPHFKTIDINGKYFSDSLLIGKVTLINFWFEGCHPCVAEFASLNNIFKQFHNNKLFNFITLTFDGTASIMESIKKYSLQFSIFSVSEEECHKLNFGSGFPTNIIVDKQGKIAFFKSGGAIDAIDASQEIDSTILPKLSQLLEKD